MVLFEIHQRFIIPENICKCDPQHPVNLSKSGAKVKGIYEQLSLFQEEYKGTQVKNIIVHVGTNHLPRDPYVPLGNESDKNFRSEIEHTLGEIQNAFIRSAKGFLVRKILKTGKKDIKSLPHKKWFNLNCKQL